VFRENLLLPSSVILRLPAKRWYLSSQLQGVSGQKVLIWIKWKCLTAKFLENQKHVLGLSGHFKVLRNDTMLNVYVRHYIAEVVKCWTCRPHEGYDTLTHMLFFWRGGHNLDDRENNGEAIWRRVCGNSFWEWKVSDGTGLASYSHHIQWLKLWHGTKCLLDHYHFLISNFSTLWNVLLFPM